MEWIAWIVAGLVIGGFVFLYFLYGTEAKGCASIGVGLAAFMLSIIIGGFFIAIPFITWIWNHIICLIFPFFSKTDTIPRVRNS